MYRKKNIMPLIAVAGFVIALTAPGHAATIVSYDFSGNSGTPTSVFPGVTATDLDISNSVNTSFNNNRVEVDRAGNKDVVLTNYMSFMLAADLGMLLDLSQMLLDTQTTGQGFRTGAFHVRSDFDGFTTDLGVADANTGSPTMRMIDLTSLPDLSTIEFRIYAVETNPDFAGNFAFDNLIVEGDQVAAADQAVVPEPTSALLALLGLGGLGLASRRRRSA